MTVLTDPRYVVPPLPPADGGGLDRLRRSVARFGDGPEHAVRRAAEARLLAGVPTAGLRSAARAATLAAAPADPAVPLVPRVPLTVLAAALGAADPAAVAGLVPVVAAAYFPGTGDTAAADAAVDRLLDRHGLDPARLGLLVQACAPVAALVTAARAVLGAAPAGVDAVLRAVLAGDPPVPATRRRHPGTGEPVAVPLVGIPFGAGPHRCPAEPHAMALAAGVLDALVEGADPVGPRRGGVAGADPVGSRRGGPAAGVAR